MGTAPKVVWGHLGAQCSVQPGQVIRVRSWPPSPAQPQEGLQAESGSSCCWRQRGPRSLLCTTTWGTGWICRGKNRLGEG